MQAIIMDLTETDYARIENFYAVVETLLPTIDSAIDAVVAPDVWSGAAAVAFVSKWQEVRGKVLKQLQDNSSQVKQYAQKTQTEIDNLNKDFKFDF